MKDSVKQKVSRVGIFIEENLLISSRQSGVRFDFSAIYELGARAGDVVHASAHISYAAKGPVDDRTRKVAMALRYAGFQIDLKPRTLTGTGTEKSRVDVDLAFSIARVAIQQSLDIVVLGTGDGDFVGVLHDLCTLGISTILVTPGEHFTSPDLLMAASSFLSVKELSNSGVYAA